MCWASEQSSGKHPGLFLLKLAWERGGLQHNVKDSNAGPALCKICGPHFLCLCASVDKSVNRGWLRVPSNDGKDDREPQSALHSNSHIMLLLISELVLTSAGCFCRESGFSFQHLLGSEQLSVTSIPETLTPSSGHHRNCTHGVHMHISRQDTHTHKMK